MGFASVPLITSREFPAPEPPPTTLVGIGALHYARDSNRGDLRSARRLGAGGALRSQGGPISPGTAGLSGPVVPQTPDLAGPAVSVHRQSSAISSHAVAFSPSHEHECESRVGREADASSSGLPESALPPRRRSGQRQHDPACRAAGGGAGVGHGDAGHPASSGSRRLRPLSGSQTHQAGRRGGPPDDSPAPPDRALPRGDAGLLVGRGARGGRTNGARHLQTHGGADLRSPRPPGSRSAR